MIPPLPVTGTKHSRDEILPPPEASPQKKVHIPVIDGASSSSSTPSLQGRVSLKLDVPVEDDVHSRAKTLFNLCQALMTHDPMANFEDVINDLETARKLNFDDPSLRIQILLLLYSALKLKGTLPDCEALRLISNEAKNLWPDDAALKTKIIFMCADIFTEIVKKGGGPDDLTLAIQHAQQRLSLIPQNDPQKAIYMIILRRMLQLRNRGTDNAETDHLLNIAKSLDGQSSFTKALVCIGALGPDGEYQPVNRNAHIDQLRQARTLVFAEDARVHVLVRQKLARLLLDRNGPNDVVEALQVLEEALQIPIDHLPPNPFWGIIVSKATRTTNGLKFALLKLNASALTRRNQLENRNRAIDCLLQARRLRDILPLKKVDPLHQLSQLLIDRAKPNDLDTAVDVLNEVLALQFNNPALRAEMKRSLEQLLAQQYKENFKAAANKLRNIR